MDFFTEKYKSYLLFIPGIFIKDCIDNVEDHTTLNVKLETDLKSIVPETLDNIESESDEDNYESEEDLDEEKLIKVLENEINSNENEQKVVYENKVEKVYEKNPKCYINSKLWIKQTNVLCCYCRSEITEVPFPIPVNQIKMQISEDDNANEFKHLLFISKDNKKNITDIEKSADDNLLFSNRNDKEVKAYTILDCLSCDIVCGGNYIRKVKDFRITNIPQSIKMSICIYKDLTGKVIEEIPDKDLWVVMKKFSGANGQTESEYKEKNINKEIKLKHAMKI